MCKVILYIAMSLDGYIADSEGNVGWLGGQGNAGEMLPGSTVMAVTAGIREVIRISSRPLIPSSLGTELIIRLFPNSLQKTGFTAG